ncbi:rod-binding protein [Pacificimonas sp. ICDLI1SI03]
MSDAILSARQTAVSSAPAPDAAQLSRTAKLKDAAADFEAIFARQMISAMRSASLGDGVLDSNASGTFRDQFDGAVADIMGGRGALGLGDALVRSVDRTRGDGAPATAPVGRSLQSYRDAAR